MESKEVPYRVWIDEFNQLWSDTWKMENKDTDYINCDYLRAMATKLSEDLERIPFWNLVSFSDRSSALNLLCHLLTLED